MKRALCGLVVGMLGLLFIGVTLVSANTYSIDYDENTSTSSVVGTFSIDDFAGIDSAKLYFTIKGRRQNCNSRYCWYYDSDVNFDAGSTALHHVSLAGSFETIELVLNQDTINSMLTSDELGFSVLGLDAYWWCDSGWSDGVRPSLFYLDNVILDVIPSSSVPIPGAIWLLGSGLFGLVGVRRCKKS